MSQAQAIDDRPELVCFSHLRWDFVYQRPQHLLSRAARSHRVFFIEEPIFKREGTPHLDISSRPEGVTVIVPVLLEGTDAELAEAQTRNLIGAHLQANLSGSPVLWYYTPMAVAFSRDIKASAVIYDNMDELSGFLGAPPRLLALEEELFARADLVFTGGMSLYEAKKSRHRSVHGFPSSIDFNHFSQARSIRKDPEDQAQIPHPRLGFFGVVDERMDIELLAQVADLRPDWQFVMIGPVVKIDPATLPRRSNIHWLGGRHYNELPHYLAGWDVGFMNFALNEATKFISPTKTPEFLAAGVPVVSTPITDVVKPYGEKGLVEIAHNAGEVVAKVETILARPEDAWLAKVDRHLAQGSWDKTWGGMHKLMLDATGGTAVDRPAAATLPIYATTPAE